MRRLIFGVLFLLFSAEHAFASNDSMNETQFRAEMAKVSERMRQFQGHLDITIVVKDVNDKSHEIRDSAAYHDGMLMVRSDKDGITRVRCLNQRYGFELNRPSDGGASATLTALMQLEGNKLPPQMQEIAERTWLYPRIAYSFGSVFLPDALADPLFQVKQVSSVLQEGRELVEIKFDYTHTDETGWVTVYADFSLLCDPSLNLGIVEYRGRAASPKNNTSGRSEAKLELDTVSDLTIATRREDLTTFEVSGAVPKEVKSSTVFEISVGTNVPKAEEFYLSHYGLSEPNFEAPIWKRTSTWLIVAAVMTLVWWGATRFRTRNAVSP